MHFFFMPTLDTGSSFLLKIHINFYYQYVKFRNAAFEKVHLDLLQSFSKIKLNTHIQLSKKFMDKFCSLTFCAFSHLS